MTTYNGLRKKEIIKNQLFKEFLNNLIANKEEYKNLGNFDEDMTKVIDKAVTTFIRSLHRDNFLRWIGSDKILYLAYRLHNVIRGQVRSISKILGRYDGSCKVKIKG